MTDDPLDGLPELLPEAREPTKLVGVDDNGNRVGEDHPRAKLSDHDVELIRELWDTRHEWGGSVRKIAEKFEVSKSLVHFIVTFQRRASYPVGWRRVKLVVNGHERVANASAVRRERVGDML